MIGWIPADHLKALREKEAAQEAERAKQAAAAPRERPRETCRACQGKRTRLVMPEHRVDLCPSCGGRGTTEKPL